MPTPPALIDPQPSPATLPDGVRVYAIGDVHGCIDQLADMHRQIAGDLAARPVSRAVVIHLGDYIDRGPDSAGAVDELLRPWPGPAPVVINLKGNHEDLMLEALDEGGTAIDAWLSNGGDAALRSWRAPVLAGRAEWLRAIPPPHMALLRGLSLRHEEGGYLFVHAGIRPGVSIEAQQPHDMIWIREPFLSWRKPFAKVVVHGHTPTKQVVVRKNRIGIDTGAVYGGKLSCAVVDANQLGFLEA